MSAAREASGFRYQNPISRYEQTPTSSQAQSSINVFSAMTKVSMDAVNKLRNAK